MTQLQMQHYMHINALGILFQVSNTTPLWHRVSYVKLLKHKQSFVFDKGRNNSPFSRTTF